MSVSYQTVAIEGWSGVNNGSYLSITKPSGLAVGDLMIAHISVVDEDSSSGAVTPEDAWTSLGSQIRSDTNGMAGMRVYYKVANSSDVAAGSFRFQNNSGEGMGMAGAIYRIADWYGTPTMAGADVGNTASPSFANTITPPTADCLFLFLYTGTDSSAPSQAVSGYAVATDNPSWTERYDQFGNLFGFFGSGNGAEPIMSGATATRTATTATGDSSCTLAADNNYNIGVMVVIDSLPPPTVTTQAVSDISLTTATGNGNVTSDGGSVITERGIVWATTTTPTTANSKSAVSGTTGAFTAPITALTANTFYYVRAYAINAIGTSYGSQETFTTSAVETNQIIKDINGVEGETYAVSVDVGGTTGTVTVQLGTTGTSQVIAAGAGVTVFQGTYGGLSGLIFTASATFDGYIDNVYWVLVLGDATIDWDLDTLTNVYPINSSVYFKRLEDQEFDRFRIYRYLDVQFKDLNAYVTVLLKKEANEDLTTRSKEFLVSNVSGETLPFIDKRISTLLKGQALRVGFSNNNLNETFTVCQFVLRGVKEPRKLFDKSKIISV